MSTVVFRCPHCGTTHASAGECDACHEADVRWWCPNHTPGRWLDAPACTECGATLDRAPAVRPTPSPRRETPRYEGPARVPPPLGEPRRPTRPRHPLEELEEILRRRRDPREVGRLDHDEDVEAPPGWRVEPPIRISAGPVFGCIGGLMRLVMTVLILIAMGTCFFMSGGGGFVLGSHDAPGRVGSLASAMEAGAARSALEE